MKTTKQLRDWLNHPDRKGVISIRELEKRINCPRSTLGQWLTGKRELPSKWEKPLLQQIEKLDFSNGLTGYASEYARFFLHITPEFKRNKQEMEAAFSVWNEEFGIRGANWCGWCYPINNRREFALVPAIIRKAERLGYRVSTSMWDVELGKEVYLEDEPSFWKALAMALAYFE